MNKCSLFHQVSQIRCYPISSPHDSRYGVNCDNFLYFGTVLNSHTTDGENLVTFESLKRCAYLSFLDQSDIYYLF
jgi:hypothetical protein